MVETKSLGMTFVVLAAGAVCCSVQCAVCSVQCAAVCNTAVSLNLNFICSLPSLYCAEQKIGIVAEKYSGLDQGPDQGEQ